MLPRSGARHALFASLLRAYPHPLCGADHQGAGREDEAGHQGRDRRQGPGASLGPGVPARRTAAGDGAARDACASSARTAGCRRRCRACRRSTPAARAACSTSCSDPTSPPRALVYLLLRRAARRQPQRHQPWRAAGSSAKATAAARRRAGHLPAGALLCLERPLRLAHRLLPRRLAVRDARRPLLGPRRGAEPGQSPGQAGAPHVRRQPARRQPQEGRLAAGDLVDRPPQRAGRGAPPGRPASCGPSSTARAAATRSTCPKPARTTAGR